jgi:SH3-like domain-containing protein
MGQTAVPGGFRSIGVAAAVLYDAPSTRARKLFVAPRGMPVEVLSTVNQWVKVRDQAGDVAWIERADLSGTRTVVTTTIATVRTQPNESAPAAFQVERAMAIEWLDPSEQPTWLRVRVRDGSQGFVRSTEVWGF